MTPSSFGKTPSWALAARWASSTIEICPTKGLFELGKLLANLALPEQKVRPLFEKNLTALKEGEALRIRLRIDVPELAQLPWEFMLLPQASGEAQATDFLALRPYVSIVRTDTVEAAGRTLPERTPCVIGVLARPEDQDKLNVDKDKQALETAVKAFNQAAGQETISLTWVEKPATRDKLVEALKDGADIFQYSGHATFELNQEGKLVLEDQDNQSDLYPAAQLAQLLCGAGVRLVVLSACETGRRNGRLVWSGIAPALTRQKVPAVIANQFDILDTNAILLAARIYPRLLSGYTIDEALMEARRAIYQQKDGLEKRDWGVPVLYLHDERGVLFPVPEKTMKKEQDQGLFIRVARTLDRVAGEAIEVEINKMTHGRIEVTTHIGVVPKGGKSIGIKIGTL